MSNIKDKFSFGNTALNTLGTLQDYQGRRSTRQGRISAGLASYVNFQIFQNPWMMAAQIAPSIIRKFAIERPQNHMHSIRRASAVFSHGPVPDNDLAAAGRAASMQSAVSANASLKLSGHSFAGMEAATFAGRYK